MILWLGTHEISWLRRIDVPLFISRRRLERQRRLPEAIGPWALDSGGFTELTLHGRWETSAHAYVQQVRRYVETVGNLAWAAPRDWMCEPDMLRRTGRSVQDHQRLTVADYLDLRERAPELPFVPVLQGWTPDDYLRHADQYQQAGVTLERLPLVAVGTVCRRQNTVEGRRVIETVAQLGAPLHAFGFKATGLAACGHLLASSDSLAWSYVARKARQPLMPGCTHATCANCMAWALEWRERLTRPIRQEALWP